MQSTSLAKPIKQIWPQKYLVVQYNDQICNSSSNIKWVWWKLSILEIRPMLTFWSMLTSKIIVYLNSVTWNIYPLQISSQLDNNWGFYKLHLTCWPWANVDLLVHIDLKNNWLVEFNDLKHKSSSNFKSIGWKLRILEIPP